MSSTIDFMFSLTESILIYWLINCAMSSRFSGTKKTFAIVLAILINAAFIQYVPDFPITARFLLYFIFSLILSQIIYTGKIFIKAFFILVANYIILISDIIAGNFASYLIKINIQNILNVSITSFAFSILAKLLSVILLMIFIYYFQKIKFEIPQRYWIIMDVIVLFLAIILQFIMEISPILQEESSEYSIYIFGISIGFLIISGLVIFFFGEICFYHEKQKENYILSMRNHSLEQQLNYHESATADLKRVRHDINKNLTNISYLLKQNNINDSVAYIDAITKALEGTKSIVNCGNDIIDAILNYKIAVCKLHNLDIRIDIDHIPHLSIDPIDLTAILANILDNAIEALDIMETGERYISGRIFCYKNYLSIVVKNPYFHQLIMENNKIDTHKADKLHHGYGLASIRSSAEKYGGSFKIYTENSIFSAVVMLPIEINL